MLKVHVERGLATSEGVVLAKIRSSSPEQATREHLQHITCDNRTE
jgi:hypothetical protein